MIVELVDKNDYMNLKLPIFITIFVFYITHEDRSHSHIMHCLNYRKDRSHPAEMSLKLPTCPSPQLALSQLEPHSYSDQCTCHFSFWHSSYRI